MVQDDEVFECRYNTRQYIDPVLVWYIWYTSWYFTIPILGSSSGD